jgi:glutathione-independent formaldehyde dehydrogenase
MKAVVWRGDSQIVSHCLPLSQAPAAFQKFDQRIDGYIKVILDPQT